jgi:hypothetical protein
MRIPKHISFPLGSSTRAVRETTTSAKVRPTFVFVLPLLLVGLSAPAMGSDTLTIATPTFAKSAIVPTPVQTECRLPEKLASFIESYAPKKRFDAVQVTDQGGSGKVLIVEITDLVGTGGGAWSGSKAVTISGKLMEGDKTIGSFIGRRTSGGGLYGGFKGTCSILGRCVKALGKDIGAWLKTPSTDSRIGEFK